ncbi:MAG: SpoIIE family protein phosphatase [Calditrichaeota bacterium]|nr:SpoIIE family protein phosphatase [Calditrichota bacterium]
MKLSYLGSFRERHKNELQSDELDKRLLELSALFELSQLLNSSLNLKSILDNILLIPMGRMMLSRGIGLLKKENDQFKIVNVKGVSKDWLDKTVEIRNFPDEPLLVSEFESDFKWVGFFKELQIELLLPLLFQDENKGIIGFSRKLNAQPFTIDEIDFLSSLSNIAAQAIENALMFEQLKKLNRSLDQKIQELNTLFEIGKELNQIFDEPGILKQLSFSLMGQMLVNQFFIVLRKKSEWQLAFNKGSLFPQAACKKVLSFCDQLSSLKEPLMVHDESDYSGLKKLKIQLVVPMDIKGKVEGFIFLGPRMDQKPYDQLQLEFISTLANIAMISIENSRLIQETIEKERLEEELNIARSIQDRLLPSGIPAVTDYDIHGLNIPSKQVGGDYFDIIRLNEEEIIFTIADVSGKGTPAALLMSNLQAGLHTLCDEHYTLAQITSKLNQLIFRNTSVEHFITFFILKLNCPTGKFEYVNAGHNPPYILHPDQSITELLTGGLILGVMQNVSYEMGYGQFNRGDLLLMFTDGVTECMDPDQNDFSEQRVIEFLKTHGNKLSSKAFNELLVERLDQFAGGFPQMDDITLLTVKRL